MLPRARLARDLAAFHPGRREYIASPRVSQLIPDFAFEK